MTLKSYQKEFIDFLVHAQVLCFGDFVTKSGRKTPYFVNAGNFNSGSIITKAGSWYARHLVENNLHKDLTTIFGPAYKGIPLCVATSSLLYQDHDIDVGFTFDRKEEKLHGDKGRFVGTPLNEGDRVVLVEDVVTAGTTLRRMLPLLQNEVGATVSGVIVAVDRKERGESDQAALAEIEAQFSVPVHPIVTIYDIITYLSQDNTSGTVLQEHQQNTMHEYLRQYGVTPSSQ